MPCTTFTQAPQVKDLSTLLHHDYWLTTDEIDLACYHSGKDHLQMDGFQSTLLYSNLNRGGIVGTPKGQFVQVLHVKGNHWVTVSNVFSGPNQVVVYDSQASSLDKTTKQASSWMLRPQEPISMLRSLLCNSREEAAVWQSIGIFLCPVQRCKTGALPI